MKNFIITILLLFYSICTHSQSSNATTLEEYNYLTKGYRIQIESGLDMKKGYELVDFSTTKIEPYRFTFKKLIRSTTGNIAAILIIAQSNVSGRNYYYALPLNNLELLGKYYIEIGALDESMTTALNVATAKALSEVIN